MGQSYVKLLIGAKLSENEYEDIPHPKLELTVHVVNKCFQSGCILGTLSGTITTLVKPSNRNAAGFVSNITKHGSRLALVGVCIGPVMTYGRMRSLENDAIVDRVYRLRHNKGQVRVDRADNSGFVGGPLVAKAFGYPLLFGMVTAVAGGVTAMAVYNNSGKK